MYKKLSILFCLLSNIALAQSVNSGNFDMNLKFTANVPQLCNITSIKMNINAGEYIKNAITAQDYFYANCYNNTVLELEIPMGSNPNSTSEKRRLPLNGEEGDVKHYALYSLHANSPNTQALGTGNDKYTEKLTGSKNIYIYFKILGNQLLQVGEYKDNLNINITYY